MVGISLKCFECGSKKDVVIDKEPVFAFELVGIAHNAGMLGVIDSAHHRTLVFCNDECCNKNMTKKGTFRMRPAYIKGE